MSENDPRGVRNNNPGNLIISADKWQGLSEKQVDPKFFEFKDPVYGIRALARTLITYQDKHNCGNVREIINRFAPSVENNTESYIASVCRYMNVADTTPLNLHEYGDLRDFCEAIIEHENGRPWRTWYNEAQMAKAMIVSGVEPKRRSLVKSPQMVGSSIAAAAAIAAPVVQQVQDQIMPFTEYSAWIKYAFVGLVLIGAVTVMISKINERRKGVS